MAAMASSIDGHPISLKAPGFFPCPFHRGSILQRLSSPCQGFFLSMLLQLNPTLHVRVQMVKLKDSTSPTDNFTANNKEKQRRTYT